MFLEFFNPSSADEQLERLAEYYANGEMTKKEFTKAKKAITKEKFKVLVASCNSAKLSKQTFVAQENMRQKGRITGYAPIGYSNVIDSNRITDVVLDSSNSNYINTLFTLYSTGNYTVQTIVEVANQFGLVGKISQKPLTKQAVVYILHNPFYCGYARHKGKLYRHCYQTLINEYLFLKCQELLIYRGIIPQESSINLKEAA